MHDINECEGPIERRDPRASDDTLHTLRMNGGSVRSLLASTQLFVATSLSLFFAFSQRYAGKKFHALGGAAWDEIEIDSAGWGSFTCHFGKVQIWVPRQ